MLEIVFFNILFIKKNEHIDISLKHENMLI